MGPVITSFLNDFINKHRQRTVQLFQFLFIYFREQLGYQEVILTLLLLNSNYKNRPSVLKSQ